MIVNTNHHAVDTTSFKTEEFSTANNPVLYKLLYSSMYENKEKVVLQELAANALDAHTAVGKGNVPITINIPNKLNPELVVSDQGVGMSEETVRNVYPVYGSSTKSSDADAVGGFGLGSKSPFALSSSFTAETTHKGITTVVMCFLDNGMPKFTIASSKEQGRPDGTTIRIPITSTATSKRLEQECEGLFRFWETTPNITGCKQVRSESVLEVRDSMVLVESSDFIPYWQKKFEILVGPYLYKVPSSLVERINLIDPTIAPYAYSLSNFKSHDRTCTIHLKVCVNTLELSPTRESLEDTEENAKILIREFDKIKKLLPAEPTTLITKEMQEQLVDLLCEHGIFSDSGMYLGVDLENINPFLEKVTGGSTSLSKVMWQASKSFDYEDNSSNKEHQKTLRDKFPQRLRSARNYGTRLCARSVISSAASCATLHLHEAADTGNVRIVGRTRNGRYSCSAHRLPPTADIRTAYVVVGSLPKVNTKLYNWCRLELPSDESVILIPNEEGYNDIVNTMDRLYPLEDESKRKKPVREEDIEDAWKRKPKAKRSSSSGGRITKTSEVLPTTTIGKLYNYEHRGGACTLAHLAKLLQPKHKRTIVFAHKVLSPVASHFSYDQRFMPCSLGLSREVPTEGITDNIAVMEITKTMLRNKYVKELLDNADEAVTIVTKDEIGSIQDFRQYRETKEVMRRLEVANKNSYAMRLLQDIVSLSRKCRDEGMPAELLRRVSTADEVTGKPLYKARAHFPTSMIDLLELLPQGLKQKIGLYAYAGTTYSTQVDKIGFPALSNNEVKQLTVAINKLYKERKK